MAKFSRTGKPLCCRCRKLATHEGNYHRSRENGGAWQPGKLYYCAGHAANCKDALPMAALAVALEAIQDDITPTRLRAALQQTGVACTPDQAQDALWSRWPDKYAWSKEGYYVSALEARREQDQRISPRFQAGMDSFFFRVSREG